MKGRKAIFIAFLIGLFFSCNKERLEDSPATNTNNNNAHLCTDSNCNHPDGHIFFQNGIRYLWGGNDDDWHFNISSFDLEQENLKSGLGREFFKALIEPEYIGMNEIPQQFNDDDEFIIVYADEGVKAYSLDLMVHHEVINDVIDGEPVMVGYCVIADFAAVYSRSYCGEAFTFALSGYVYSEPGVWFGRDGFLLWDRDTESLWWPLSGKAVSGGMIGTDFNTELSFEWDRVDWKFIKSNFTDVKILAYGQDMEIPTQWRNIDPNGLDCN